MLAALILGGAVLAATPVVLWVSTVILAKLLTLARLDQDCSSDVPWH